jgi:TonB family protein
LNDAEVRPAQVDPALKAAGRGVVEGSRDRREYPRRGPTASPCAAGLSILASGALLALTAFQGAFAAETSSAQTHLAECQARVDAMDKRSQSPTVRACTVSENDDWLLIQAPPVFPRKAYEDRVTGWVAVEITVERDGMVKEVRVRNAMPRGYFEASAVASQYYSRFIPKHDGLNLVIARTIKFSLAAPFTELEVAQPASCPNGATPLAEFFPKLELFDQPLWLGKEVQLEYDVDEKGLPINIAITADNLPQHVGDELVRAMALSRFTRASEGSTPLPQAGCLRRVRLRVPPE